MQIDIYQPFINYKLLAYADDIDIIGRGLRDVTAAFSIIEKQSTEVGLVVNEDKTKLFVSTNKESSRMGRCLNVDFKVEDDVVYLGSGFRQDDSLSCDLFNIVMVMIMRKPAVNRNGNVWKSKDEY